MDVRSSGGTVETVRNDVKVLFRVIKSKENTHEPRQSRTVSSYLLVSAIKLFHLRGTILTSALVILYCLTQYRTVTSTLDLLKKTETETFQMRVSSKLSPPQ